MCEVRIVRRGKAPPPMMSTTERNSLVEGIYPLIRKLSRRFRPTPIYDADDVAQEAALSAILRSGSYSRLAEKVAPSTWAFNIVRNAIRDHIERQERRSRGVVSFDQHEEFAELLLVDDSEG